MTNMEDRRNPRLVMKEFSLFLLVLLLALNYFLVPKSIQNAFAFHHESFNVYGLFTAAFVHSSNSHLLGNVVGYLITTLYAFALCLYVDERRWFRRTVIAAILILPIPVNLVSYTFFQLRYPEVSPVSRGFSGVVAGLAGFLLVALAVYVANRYNNELGQVVGLSVFLLVMAEIDFIYARGFRPLVVGLVVLGIGLQIGTYLWQHSFDVEQFFNRWVLLDVVGVVFVIGVPSFVIVSLFPSDIGGGGSFTNIIAHAAGFLLGILLSATLYYREMETKDTLASPVVLE